MTGPSDYPGGGWPETGYSPQSTETYPQTEGYDATAGRDYVTTGPPIPKRTISMGAVVTAATVVLIILGVVLLLAAKIYSAELIRLDYDSWSDGEDEQKAEDIQYNSVIIVALGVAFISIGLIIAAMLHPDIGDPFKSGLAIAAGIVIGLSAIGLI